MNAAIQIAMYWFWHIPHLSFHAVPLFLCSEYELCPNAPWFCSPIMYGNKDSAVSSQACTPLNSEDVDWFWQRGRCLKDNQVLTSFNKTSHYTQRDFLRNLTEGKEHYISTHGQTWENPSRRETIKRQRRPLFKPSWKKKSNRNIEWFKL